MLGIVMDSIVSYINMYYLYMNSRVMGMSKLGMEMGMLGILVSYYYYLYLCLYLYMRYT